MNDRVATAGRLTGEIVERDHAIGPADAPVRLLEYGAYECPRCAGTQPVVKAVLAEFGERVRFAFRHFPLSTDHVHNQLAAEAAEAGGAQGYFWDMHEYLFAHHPLFDPAHLRQGAAAIGLDLGRFDGEMTRRVYADRVYGDFRGGVRLGVRATPSFFVNGERYEGTHDFGGLVQAIRAMAGR